MTPRLAIVSSAPLTEADAQFMGRLLATHQLRWEDVYVGFVGGPTFVDRKPNCYLLLGESALRLFHPNHNAKVSDWRGSIFTGSLCDNFKCVATFSPSDCLGLPENLALLRFDLKRAVEEAHSVELLLPRRTIHWNWLGAAEIVECLEGIRDSKKPVGHDVEGYPAKGGVTDFSFALSPTEAVWIPLARDNHCRWWPPQWEASILAATRALLEDPAVPKVGHALAFEGFIWGWAHGITLRGIADDSMLAFQSLYSELPRNLSAVASILTRQPYWGTSGEQTTTEERAIYNTLDSMLSLEIMEAIRQLPEWDSVQSHYRGRVSLLPAVIQQMLAGAAFDGVGRKACLAQVEEEIDQWQGRLDRLAGIQPPTLQEVAQEVCYLNKAGEVKELSQVVEHAKPSWLRRAGS